MDGQMERPEFMEKDLTTGIQKRTESVYNGGVFSALMVNLF